MALEERTRPYETLIRHNADGSVGAHHCRISEVLRDGVVINSQVLDPISVAGAGLEEVICETAVAALAECELLRLDMATAQRAITELEDEINRLNLAFKDAADAYAAEMARQAADRAAEMERQAVADESVVESAH